MSIIADLGALEVEPVASHALLVLLRFGLQRHRPDGLRDREEAEASARVEAGLTTLMQDTIDGWPLGHVILNGEVILPFYGRAEPPQPLDGWAPYTVQVTTQDDPEWSYLREVMAPDAAEQRQIASLRQLHALLEYGDQIAVEREVDWTITVPDDAAAAAVASDLRAAGYRVSHPAALVINATASHNLELIALIQRQEDVAAIAERHGGAFDGWGSPIVTSPPPGKRRRWSLRGRS